MAYSKQELLDWITNELPDDAEVAFFAHEVGEEALIDDLFVELGELEEEELLDMDLCLEDEEATHIVFLV